VTAIAGIVQSGRVHLAGDSAITAGWALTISAHPKVFRVGPYVIGTSGSPRVAQLMRYALDVPEPLGDLHRFMATVFIDAVRQTLKDGGAATKESERESTGSSFALVGVHGRLFEIQSDYQVGESANGYAAIGCGFEPCLGALYATPTLAPRRRLQIAMEAAELLNAAVRGPFAFASTPKAVK
jgi:ATP-dependent protease HslVU (ClpYQ) peptidase subunit